MVVRSGDGTCEVIASRGLAYMLLLRNSTSQRLAMPDNSLEEDATVLWKGQSTLAGWNSILCCGSKG